MQRRTRFDLLAVGICSFMMAVPAPALAVDYQRAGTRDLPHGYDQSAERAVNDSVGTISANQSARVERPLASYSIADIELHGHGTLVGHVAGRAGNPLVGQEVIIRQGQDQAATAITDSRGRFAVGNLRGGVYQVSSAGADRLFRAWAEGTAPPIAERQALIVTEPTVVRGQGRSCGGCGECNTCCRRRGGAVTRLLHNPWILATLVGAAIAIPIGISVNDKDPPPPAS